MKPDSLAQAYFLENLFFKCLFIFESERARERERERSGGEAERERQKETQNLKQAPRL